VHVDGGDTVFEVTDQEMKVIGHETERGELDVAGISDFLEGHRA